MPRILIDKRTNKTVNDFQSNPAPGTLLSNAVKAGLGNIEDFEEKEVTEQKYKVEMDKVLAPLRAQREAEKQLRIQTLESAKTKLKAIGLTDEELEVLLQI